MLLGTMLARLDNEADAAKAIEALGDLVLFAEVRAMGAHHDETPGEYVAGAAGRFAARASDEDWLGLMTALERSDTPARAALERIVRWGLARDAAGDDSGAPPGVCACGSKTGGRHDHL